MTPALSRLAPWALGGVALGTLGNEALGIAPAGKLAAFALVVYLVACWHRLPLKGRGFLWLSLALAGLLPFLSDSPVTAVLTALERAAFVATLFTVLGFLGDAAHSSRMVRRCGMFLANQPPGQRYLALFTGGHLFGLILNYGAISLLGTMSERSTLGESETVRRIRLKRMLLATNRGFISTLTWAPMTMAMAVTLTALPGLKWTQIFYLCAVNGVSFLLIGWFLDWASKPRPSLLSAPPAPRTGDWGLVLPLVGVVLLVFVSGLSLAASTGISLVVAVMSCVPPIAAGWMFVQFWPYSHEGAPRLLARRLVRHTRLYFPGYCLEVAILSSAAFIGTLAAKALPMETVALFLDRMDWPPWSLAVGATWAIVALGQVGLNPILSVVVISAAFPHPEALGLSPVVLAVAYTGGWALTGASSPFTATTMIVGRIYGTSAGEVGRRWNGPYTVLGAMAVSAWLIVLSRFLTV